MSFDPLVWGMNLANSKACNGEYYGGFQINKWKNWGGCGFNVIDKGDESNYRIDVDDRYYPSFVSEGQDKDKKNELLGELYNQFQLEKKDKSDSGAFFDKLFPSGVIVPNGQVFDQENDKAQIKAQIQTQGGRKRRKSKETKKSKKTKTSRKSKKRRTSRK